MALTDISAVISQRREYMHSERSEESLSQPSHMIATVETLHFVQGARILSAAKNPYLSLHI
jgi:hypothetical protein